MNDYEKLVNPALKPPKTKFTQPLPKQVEIRDDQLGVRLTCKVNRAEAGVFWSKDGKRLIDTEDIKIEESGYERRLIMSEIDEEMGGLYA